MPHLMSIHTEHSNIQQIRAPHDRTKRPTADQKDIQQNKVSFIQFAINKNNYC